MTSSTRPSFSRFAGETDLESGFYGRSAASLCNFTSKDHSEASKMHNKYTTTNTTATTTAATDIFFTIYYVCTVSSVVFFAHSNSSPSIHPIFWKFLLTSHKNVFQNIKQVSIKWLSPGGHWLSFSALWYNIKISLSGDLKNLLRRVINHIFILHGILHRRAAMQTLWKLVVDAWERTRAF